MNTEKRTLLTAVIALATGLCLALPGPAAAAPSQAAKDAGAAADYANVLLATADPNPAEDKPAQKPEVEETTNAPATENATDAASSARSSSSGVKREAMVVFGQNAELKAGDSAEAVVVIGGSVKVHGKVHDAVVVIGGDAEVDSEVGQAVVAVLGNIHLRPGALVHQDAVSVGGKVEVAEGAKVDGQVTEVPIAGVHLPRMDWVQKWLEQCVLMLRPLSPRVGWVWMVALVYFLLFLLIAAVFRTPVQACVNELTHRPATTFIMGLLTKLFLPLLVLLLLVIVIGIVVLPFLLAGLFVLGLVGKVAVLEWVGGKVGALFGKEELKQPVAALVLGSVIIALLYMIPVIGLLTMLILSVWSLGCAITAAFGGFRRELPEKQPAGGPGAPVPMMGAGTPPPMPAAAFAAAAQPAMAGTAPAGEPRPAYQASGTTPAATSTLEPEPPVLPDILTYPKATFWQRMAAGFLDLVLLVILGAIVSGPPLALIVALAYFAGLWTWRGTSIGGIVLGLKVVRMDGQPVTFAVALVRALAAAFSGIVLFLGFFWIAWDADKQGWHDKIAGTVVLSLPRGTPLLCL